MNGGKSGSKQYTAKVCQPTVLKDFEMQFLLEHSKMTKKESRSKSRRKGRNYTSKNSFDSLLLEAIDEALASLGESCKNAVYQHLEKTFKIKRHDIPSKIEEFTQAIENISELAAKLIEIQIMKCLYKKIGKLKYIPDKELTFTSYIAAAKNTFK